MFDLINVGVGIMSLLFIGGCIFILAIEWCEDNTTMEDVQEAYNEYKVERNRANLDAYEELKEKLAKGEVDRDKLLLMLTAHSLGVDSGIVLYDTEGEEDEL